MQTNIISERAQNLENLACELESIAVDPEREFRSAKDRKRSEKRLRGLAVLLRAEAKDSE